MQSRGFRPDPLREAYEAGQREARQHFRPVPQPEFMYVQHPNGSGPVKQSVSSKNIVVNLPTVLTIVFFAITTTIGGALAWSEISSGIAMVSDKVTSLARRVERVEERQTAVMGYYSQQPGRRVTTAPRSQPPPVGYGFVNPQ